MCIISSSFFPDEELEVQCDEQIGLLSQSWSEAEVGLGAFWLWNPGRTDTLQFLRVEIGCLNRKEWRKLVNFVVLTMWFHWCPNLITWTFKTFLQLIAEEQVTLILSVRRVLHQGSQLRLRWSHWDKDPGWPPEELNSAEQHRWA